MVRKLRFEKLDTRVVFAIDFDFDFNGQLDSLDPLSMIDTMHGFRPSNNKMDVDGDGKLTESDVLRVTEQVNAEFSARIAPMAKGGGGGSVKPTFQYWRSGSAANSLASSVSGGLGLMGGGVDVDRLFQWMGQKSYPRDGF